MLFMCFNRLFVKDIFLALYQGYFLLINYKLHLLFNNFSCQGKYCFLPSLKEIPTLNLASNL